MQTTSYDSFVPELVEGRLRARILVKKYNEYLPDDATDESLNRDREVMLKEFIGHVGQGVCIDPPFRVDYGCNIIIGDGFYANFKCGCRLDSKLTMAANISKPSLVW
jgi:hypothetical protein